MKKQTLRIGVGGPVGSGKTALLRSLCSAMRDHYNIAVVTNDIYTQEDAKFLTQHEALDADRIIGVETGGCTKSDLLIINKTDLAPLVGASLEVMAHDAKIQRGDRPFIFSNLKKAQGLDEIIQIIVSEGMLEAKELPAAKAVV